MPYGEQIVSLNVCSALCTVLRRLSLASVDVADQCLVLLARLPEWCRPRHLQVCVTSPCYGQTPEPAKLLDVQMTAI